MYHYADTSDVSFYEAHACEDYTPNRVCQVCGAAAPKPNCKHNHIVDTGTYTSTMILMKCVDCGELDWVNR